MDQKAGPREAGLLSGTGCPCLAASRPPTIWASGRAPPSSQARRPELPIRRMPQAGKAHRPTGPRTTITAACAHTAARTSGPRARVQERYGPRALVRGRALGPRPTARLRVMAGDSFVSALRRIRCSPTHLLTTSQLSPLYRPCQPLCAYTLAAPRS